MPFFEFIQVHVIFKTCHSVWTWRELFHNVLSTKSKQSYLIYLGIQKSDWLVINYGRFEDFLSKYYLHPKTAIEQIPNLGAAWVVF